MINGFIQLILQFSGSYVENSTVPGEFPLATRIMSLRYADSEYYKWIDLLRCSEQRKKARINGMLQNMQ